MPQKSSDIVCYESGTSSQNAWMGRLAEVYSDLPVLMRLHEKRVLRVLIQDETIHIAGESFIGVIVLPSDRRIRILSKISNLVTLEWLAYVGDFPNLRHWLQDAGIDIGGAFPKCLARLFLRELDRVTHCFLKKDYVSSVTRAPTVRGRILYDQLACHFSRLPSVPQTERCRSLDTAANILLACALDRIHFFLDDSTSQHTWRLFRNLRNVWACIKRDPGDLATTISQASWGAPHGYRCAIQLARLILMGASVDQALGFGGDIFTINMGRTWERALQLMLQEVADGFCDVLSGSEKTRRWHDEDAETEQARWMTVDALIERVGTRWVFDAKYKSKFGDESRADRFQMGTYALAFDANIVSLVYPSGTEKEASCRTLLATRVGNKNILIESINLPMALGPELCRDALRKLMQVRLGTIEPNFKPTDASLHP